MDESSKEEAMNNLVKTLLAKAHLEYHPDTNKVAERFANLIVLECINTLTNDDGATHHKELLIKRFNLNETSISNNPE